MFSPKEAGRQDLCALLPGPGSPRREFSHVSGTRFYVKCPSFMSDARFYLWCPSIMSGAWGSLVPRFTSGVRFDIRCWVLHLVPLLYICCPCFSSGALDLRQVPQFYDWCRVLNQVPGFTSDASFTSGTGFTSGARFYVRRRLYVRHRAYVRHRFYVRCPWGLHQVPQFYDWCRVLYQVPGYTSDARFTSGARAYVRRQFYVRRPVLRQAPALREAPGLHEAPVLRQVPLGFTSSAQVLCQAPGESGAQLDIRCPV